MFPRGERVFGMMFSIPEDPRGEGRSEIVTAFGFPFSVARLLLGLPLPKIAPLVPLII